jgi:hypothetical protein
VGLQAAPFDIGEVALVSFSHTRYPTEQVPQNPFSDSFITEFSEVRIAPVHYYSAVAFSFARRTGRAVNTMLAPSILCGGIYLGAPSTH